MSNLNNNNRFINKIIKAKNLENNKIVYIKERYLIYIIVGQKNIILN